MKTAEDADSRITCTRCQHYRALRCMNAKTAQLGACASIEVGTELANKPHHCPGFKERKQ